MRSLINPLRVIFVLASSYVYSQSVSNSAYNVYGIGTLDQQGLTAFSSMGYSGIATRPEEVVNIENPAALTSISGYNQIFDAGLFFSSLQQTSGEGSFSGTSGGLNDLNYWFRTSEKSAFSFGFTRFSEGSYDITDRQSGVSTIGLSDSRHLGEGGSTTAYVAAGFNPLKNLNVGVRANFLFSSQQSSEFLNIGDLNTELRIENSSRFTKAMLDFGAQYSLALSGTTLTLGAIFRPGANTSVREESLIVGSGVTSDSIASEANSSLYLPQKTGFGIGIKRKSFELAAEYEWENWGSNEEQDGFSYKDRFTASIGGQYQKNRFSNKYADRLSLRFGAGISSNYLTVDRTNYLNRFISVGVGAPIGRTGLLNIGYEYYQQGTTESDLILENSSTLSVGISFRGVWFRKRVYQ